MHTTSNYTTSSHPNTPQSPMMSPSPSPLHSPGPVVSQSPGGGMLQSPMSPHSMQQSPRLGTPHSQVCIELLIFAKVDGIFNKFLLVFRAKKVRLAQDRYLLRALIASHLHKLRQLVILGCHLRNIEHAWLPHLDYRIK